MIVNALHTVCLGFQSKQLNAIYLLFSTIKFLLVLFYKEKIFYNSFIYLLNNFFYSMWYIRHRHRLYFWDVLCYDFYFIQISALTYCKFYNLFNDNLCYRQSAEWRKAEKKTKVTISNCVIFIYVVFKMNKCLRK